MASEAQERTAKPVISVEPIIVMVYESDWLELRRKEQQLTTERARHASMAAEFELIATGTHPLYVMRCDVEAPPVSEQEGERFDQFAEYLKMLTQQNTLIAQQLVDCLELRQSLEKSTATIREQAEEIERLKAQIAPAGKVSEKPLGKPCSCDPAYRMRDDRGDYCSWCSHEWPSGELLSVPAKD